MYVNLFLFLSFFFYRDAGHKCPVDNEILLEKQLFPDNFAKREILSLIVKCPNKGCNQKMELRHLEVGTLRNRINFSPQFRHKSYVLLKQCQQNIELCHKFPVLAQKILIVCLLVWYGSHYHYCSIEGGNKVF